MSNYAVVRIGGKQFGVSEGDELKIDHLDGKEGEEISFSEVLLFVSGDQVEIGNPTVDAKVFVKVLSQEKGKKVRVIRFKAKSRYRKTRGFRAQLTKVKVTKIQVSKEKKEAPKKVTPKRKAKA